MAQDIKWILTKQHIGAPCKPIIEVGTSVLPGTLLAVPQGLGAPVYASLAGTVEDITAEAIGIRPEASPAGKTGKKSEEKIAENIEESTKKNIEENTEENMEESTEKNIGVNFWKECMEFVPMDCEGLSLLEIVEKAGIVGMGGAGFPTAVKLKTDLKGGYLLVNAAECEPLLAHNIDQLEGRMQQTLRGIRYAMEICHASQAVIAIKAKHEKTVELLREALKEDGTIRLHLLPDLYPMGEERAIVREVLGILLRPDQLPSAAGAVVINVETVLRIQEAVEEKRPCITKNVTVAGKLKGGTWSRVFRDVPIGITVGELIEQAGGIDGGYGEIIMGGPFTGKSVTRDTPITKTTGGILVTEPFPDLQGKRLGLLLCACGGNEARMQELAQKMNAEVVLVQACKQAEDVKGTLKCQNPGNCPGQAQKCLNFKKAGCEAILIGNCTDCTNTVMGSAPKLGLEVIHQTDHVFRTAGLEPMRYLTKSKKIEWPGAVSEKQMESNPLDKEQQTENPALDNNPADRGQQMESIPWDGFHFSVKEGKEILLELELW